MPVRPKVNHAGAIARAILTIVGRDGYNAITANNVAKAAKLIVPDVAKFSSDRPGLVAVVWGWVDSTVQASVSQVDPGTPVHDRLFEVMMARFDLLQEDRDAFIALMDGVMKDPCAWVPLLPVIHRSMGRMLECAGEPADGPYGNLNAAGLAVIYAASLHVWRTDTSEDMAATMAELDKRLLQAERIQAYIPKKST